MSHNPTPHILLTRPAKQTKDYHASLRAKFGDQIEIIESPLLKIMPIDADIDLAKIQHLLFTSINGVQAFARLSNIRKIPAVCVGARTAKAAVAAGLDTRSANGSAMDLVKLARTLSGPFMYVRGRHQARDIAQDLRQTGRQVDEVIAYDQQSLSLPSTVKAHLAGPNRCIVPLFSPRTARVFMRECEGLLLQATTVICISQNVADQLERTQFKNMVIATNSTAAAVTREIAAAL